MPTCTTTKLKTQAASAAPSLAEPLGEPLAELLAGRWELDRSASHARFTARGFAGLVRVPGEFRSLSGVLVAEEPGVRGVLAIDPSSLDTGNRLRDRHLRSSAFFSVAEHPELRYEVDSLTLVDGRVRIEGELLIAGMLTRLPLEAEAVAAGGDALMITCSTRVDRLALGIRGGRALVPPTVDLDVAVVLRRTGV